MIACQRDAGLAPETARALAELAGRFLAENPTDDPAALARRLLAERAPGSPPPPASAATVVAAAAAQTWAAALGS